MKDLIKWASGVMDSQTTLQLHIASQYLAAAGKNYVVAKDDDSHTNMGWDAEKASFRSRTFSNSDFLTFHTKQMVLEWTSKQPTSFALHGRTHANVLRWLEKTSQEHGLKEFVFDLHYHLDSGEINDDFRFGGANPASLDTHAQFRSSCLSACTDVLTDIGLDAEVRTWPHHFDTGAYIKLPGSEVGVGSGLAIPDDMSEEYYLYCSGYKGHDSIDTSEFPALSKGEWKHGKWTGAMLSVKGLKPSDYRLFFAEAIAAFKQIST